MNRRGFMGLSAVGAVGAFFSGVIAGTKKTPKKIVTMFHSHKVTASKLMPEFIGHESELKAIRSQLREAGVIVQLPDGRMVE
jgi:hypothetical protein